MKRTGRPRFGNGRRLLAHDWNLCSHGFQFPPAGNSWHGPYRLYTHGSSSIAQFATSKHLPSPISRLRRGWMLMGVAPYQTLLDFAVAKLRLKTNPRAERRAP